MDYIGLSWTILDYLGLSRTISDYLGLSGTFWDYLGLSGTFWDYLGLSRTISDWGAGESKLLFDHGETERATHAIPIGARAPKNGPMGAVVRASPSYYVARQL